MDDKNKQEIIELLTKAREIFRECGGAQGKLEDADGHVCALGALWRATELADPSLLLGSRETARYVLLKQTRRIMCKVTQEQFCAEGVAELNDQADDPKPVILDLYDATIKDLENG